MSFNNNKLYLDWITQKSTPYFDKLREEMISISETLGANFVDDPLWYLSRVVSAHPLGGCPMGRNPSEGVVDSHGEVFGYNDFYIADGSVMPGPVGANPSLTIAALSDRFADGIIKKHKSKR